MRWNKDPLKGKEGDSRIIEKFLLFPKCLTNPDTEHEEWRWFERCKIKQKVSKCDVGGSMEWGRYKRYWVNEEWVDN